MRRTARRDQQEERPEHDQTRRRRRARRRRAWPASAAPSSQTHGAPHCGAGALDRCASRQPLGSARAWRACRRPPLAWRTRCPRPTGYRSCSSKARSCREQLSSGHDPRGRMLVPDGASARSIRWPGCSPIPVNGRLKRACVGPVRGRQVPAYRRCGAGVLCPCPTRLAAGRAVGACLDQVLHPVPPARSRATTPHDRAS